MQVLSLKVNDKTYTTSRVTAYLARKAMEIDTAALKMAKAGEEIQKTASPDLAEVQALMEQMTQINDSKSWFICQIYGEKFGIEELEKEFTNEEIDAEINRITRAIYGVIEKNV